MKTIRFSPSSSTSTAFFSALRPRPFLVRSTGISLARPGNHHGKLPLSAIVHGPYFRGQRNLLTARKNRHTIQRYSRLYGWLEIARMGPSVGRFSQPVIVILPRHLCTSKTARSPIPKGRVMKRNNRYFFIPTSGWGLRTLLIPILTQCCFIDKPLITELKSNPNAKDSADSGENDGGKR